MLERLLGDYVRPWHPPDCGPSTGGREPAELLVYHVTLRLFIMKHDQ